MKKIVLCLIAMLPAFVFAQQQMGDFSIKSKIGALNTSARAFLIFQQGANTEVDSILINNGSFEFKGKLIEPAAALIVIDAKGTGIDKLYRDGKLDTAADVLNFYVEKGDIVVNSPDKVAKAAITGSKLNDDNKQLLAKLNVVEEKAKAIIAQSKTVPDSVRKKPEFQNAMQAKFKVLQLEQKEVFKDFILRHPDSFLSLLALYSVDGHSPDADELEGLYNGLSADIKSTETAKVFLSALDQLKNKANKNVAIGAMAPDFTQNDVNGVPVKLSSFRGKYVLVDFWASWCGPCRQENPNVVKAFNRYKDKNFTILGVSLDRPEGRDNWIAAIKSDNLNWTQVSDLKFWSNQAAALYYVQSIPANFLIDPQGKIIARDLRGDDLENKLQEVLAK